MGGDYRRDRRAAAGSAHVARGDELPLRVMCVVAFAWNIHPHWRLLLIGNRDELHARPTAPLARWAGTADVIAGRDLEAGGTWMGVAGGVRAAVVTNVRDPRADLQRASRGLLVSDFLQARTPAARCAARLGGDAARYRPFNLLLFDAASAQFVSNDPDVRVRRLSAGVHGLSNGDLDSAWPKVRRVKDALRHWLTAGGGAFDPLFRALGDETAAPDAALPDTGVGLALERQLSPVFVRGERYGTRASTLIALDGTGSGCIIEHRFGPGGAPEGETTMSFGSTP